MQTSIKLIQPTRKRDDWGFFVPIDIETDTNSKKVKKPTNNSIIIISQEEKLKYYLKIHNPKKHQNVIILKNFPEPSSPILIKNNYLNNCKAKCDVSKSSSSILIHKSFIIMTTILSSGLLLLFYNPSIFKLR
jgi:Ulp1 family protease